jgi:hypothetical protein
MPSDRKNENHHYVPQFYLRHWCAADGKMWVYPVENGRCGFRASPKNFATEKGLYDTSDVQHLAGIDVEGFLSRIEGIFDSRWPEVFDGTMDNETKMNISRFLALMHLRHPKHKEQVQKTKALFRTIADKVRAQGHDRFEVVHPDGTKNIIPVSEMEEFTRDTPANAKLGFLNAMHQSMEDLAKVICARKWGVIISMHNEPVYLTSDTPLVVHRGTCTKQFFGFGTPGTEVTFPISPTKLLRISDVYEEDGLHYPLISLGDLNEPIILNAARFVFSHQELKDVNA